MPINEQLEVYSQRIQRLPRYSFLLRPAFSEGEISTEVHRIHIRDIDPDQFPHRGLMEQLRTALAAKHGTPVHVLLAEQEHRLQPTAYRPMSTPPQNAGDNHHPSTISEETAPAPATSDVAPEPPPPVPSGRQRQRRHRLS
jgi:hypothetical protein